MEREREREGIKEREKGKKLPLWHFVWGVLCSTQPDQENASDSESFQAMCHLVFHFSGDLALSSVSMFFMHNLLFQSESFLRNVALKGNKGLPWWRSG